MLHVVRWAFFGLLGLRLQGMVGVGVEELETWHLHGYGARPFA